VDFAKPRLFEEDLKDPVTRFSQGPGILNKPISPSFLIFLGQAGEGISYRTAEIHVQSTRETGGRFSTFQTQIVPNRRK